MELKKFAGVIDSPPDERDFHVAAAIPVSGLEFPAEYKIPDVIAEIYDQESTMMCVAFSLALIKELEEQRERNQRIKFSKAFIYANRVSGDTIDEGMIPRQALEHLRTEGVCRAELYDELLTIWYSGLDHITEAMRTDAAKYKIASYARVYSEMEMKSAIMTLGAITASIPVTAGPKGLKGGYNEMIDQAYINQYGFGGHMITIVGWKIYNGVNYWICVNSSGSDWGDNGYFYLPFGYPFREIWTLTDAIEQKKLSYYRVQLGAFKVKENAQNLAKALVAKGFPTYLVQVDGLWKVQSGAFSTQANAKAYMDRLTAAGFKSFITYY